VAAGWIGIGLLAATRLPPDRHHQRDPAADTG